jgi:16S rRNA (uracil1498-N3)-methyltransferase
MSTRFYINSPLQPGPMALTGAEAHHLATVSRLRPGDAVCLFNGDGREYPARIVEAQRRSVLLEIERVETPDRELPFRIEVAAPLPKGDRAQFLVEKLTELGATAFVPLECQRAVIRPSEARIEKLERYVIEASKQCGRNVLMSVEAPVAWNKYCARLAPHALGWLAHPAGATPDTSKVVGPVQLQLVVGPEGGFTDEELAAAQSHGWQLIGLGPRILRIETAALALTCLALAAQKTNNPVSLKKPGLP